MLQAAEQAEAEAVAFTPSLTDDLIEHFGAENFFDALDATIEFHDLKTIAAACKGWALGPQPLELVAQRFNLDHDELHRLCMEYEIK